MELVEKNGINYFVDFAHTPDALEKTLSFLQNIKKD
ncbi:MAG: cyanophycin synthetase [bacterium]|jgi:UDP-N-acetylmuramyl tripeptide synthase